jgi:hypothetical protein
VSQVLLKKMKMNAGCAGEKGVEAVVDKADICL